MEELSILELASKGGWIMIVLAILSIIFGSIAIAVIRRNPHKHGIARIVIHHGEGNICCMIRHSLKSRDYIRKQHPGLRCAFVGR